MACFLNEDHIVSAFRFSPSRKTPPAQRVLLRLEHLEERALFALSVFGNINGIGYTGFQPPDTIGASGYTTVGEAVNLQLTFWNKSTHGVIFNQSLTSFFNSVPGIGGGVMQGSDPVMTFDVYTGQYVVGMLDYNTTNASRFDLAISNDENPADGWTGMRYNMNDGTGGFDFADYPKLGYNFTSYVFSFNMFPGLGSFNHVDILTVDKTNLANSSRLMMPGGTGNFTVNPVVTLDDGPGTPNDPIWLIQTSGSSALRLQRLLNPTSGPTFGSTLTVPVPAFSPMHAPRQPGSNMNWSFDTRLLNASQVYGQIVTGHNTSIGGDDKARVYQVDVTNPTAPVLQQTFTVGAAGEDAYFPAVSMDDNADIGITYMQSGPSEPMSMYVTGQTYFDTVPSWTGGVFQTPVRTFTGSGSYTSSRAGDYAGITIDPSDGLSFWAFQEYKGSSVWGTGITNFVPEPSTGPGGAPVPGGGSARSSWHSAAPLTENTVGRSDLGLLLGAIEHRHHPVLDEIFETW
jgi:hypothetical protein